MKHLLAAIIILFTITAGSFFCVKYTEKIASDLLGTLDACEASVASQSWERAFDRIITTNSLWEKYKPFLAFYQHHNDLDAISDLLTEVTAIVSVKDESLFKIENKRLTALVEDMCNMDTLTFENLF